MVMGDGGWASRVMVLMRGDSRARESGRFWNFADGVVLVLFWRGWRNQASFLSACRGRGGLASARREELALCDVWEWWVWPIWMRE